MFKPRKFLLMRLAKLAPIGIANPIVFLAAVVINLTILRYTIFLSEFLFRFVHVFPGKAVIYEAKKFVAKKFVECGFDGVFCFELMGRVIDVCAGISLLDLHLYYKAAL